MQGESELLPAPSGDDVASAQLGADGGDKVFQEYVTGGMAVGVVVGLEVVNVDDDDGERGTGAVGASQLAVHLLVPAATIRSPGEGVPARLRREQGDHIGAVDRGVCEVDPRSRAPGLSRGAAVGSWVEAQPNVDPVGSSGGHQGPIEVWLEQDRERGTGDELSCGAQLRAWIGIG